MFVATYFWSINNGLLDIIIKIVVGAIVYIISCFVLKVESVKEIWSYMLGKIKGKTGEVLVANVIIFTNEYFPFKGGIGRYCEEVINEIKLQHKVTLVGPAYDSSLTRDKRSEGIRLELFPRWSI